MYLHYSKLTGIGQRVSSEAHGACCFLMSNEQTAEYELKKDTHFAKVKSGALSFVLKPEFVDWSGIREAREKLLLEADVKELEQLRDDTKQDAFPSASFIAIGDYKRVLCDITETVASPSDVVWPAKPWLQ